jgi:hypothetical protein
MTRFVLIAERCCTKLLNDPDSFDCALGRGRFAVLDRERLNEVRGIVESDGYGLMHLGTHFSEAGQDERKDCAES